MPNLKITGLLTGLLSSVSADLTSWIKASTPTVSEGDWVFVKWSLGQEAAPQLASDVGEVCTSEEDGGAVKRSCSTVVRGHGCWVGEFVPGGAAIEAYFPPTLGNSEWAIPFTNPAPAKYIPCRLFSEEGGGWAASLSADGTGAFNFSTTNRRATFEYALFDGGFLRPRLLARTGPISFASNLGTQSSRSNSSSFSSSAAAAAVAGLRGAHPTAATTAAIEAAAATATAAAANDVPNGPPQHRRLARTADASSMRVSWTSAQPDLSATLGAGDNHRVKWGVASGDYSSPEVGALTASYGAADLCGSPGTDVGFVDPGHFHTAVLGPSLPPGQRIYYVVGTDAFGWSAEASFVAVDSERKTSSVLLTADMGLTYGDKSLYHWPCPRALATAKHLINFAFDGTEDGTENGEGEGGDTGDGALSWDLALHVGDISYATGYGAKWDGFMEMVEPLSSGWPYMTSMGNHERDWAGSGASGPFEGKHDSGGECGVPTAARFIMPTPTKNSSSVSSSSSSSSSNGEVVGSADGWYSFNDGPVHFAMISTEHDLSASSPQGLWLTADLSTVDRADTPWVVVAGHRQCYSCSSRNAPVADPLEPTLLAHKVDVYVAGHVHLAQRTCPLYNGTCVGGEEEEVKGGVGSRSTGNEYKAPVHAVIGHAGMTANGCTQGGFDSLGGWGSTEHGFATLEANTTDLVLRYYADCNPAALLPSSSSSPQTLTSQPQGPHPSDFDCIVEKPNLLHEYTLQMPFPRSY